MAEEKDFRENGRNTDAPSSGDLTESIEKLLKERKKIDDLLNEKFTRQITVMFTDIAGSTSFFEARGDIEGRLMVQKHNDLLFPIIQKYQGRIIKTIGDAIMAGFYDPLLAVRASGEMQQALRDYNQKIRMQEQLHIRIGINSGEGIVEAQDIFGDVVNVAARIESRCEPDQILISSAVYEAVRKSADIICRTVSPVLVKGIEGDLQLFRVMWDDEEKEAGTTLLTAAGSTEKIPNNKFRRNAFITASVILVSAGLILQWQLGRETSQDPYARAYSLLQANQPEPAQRFFEQLAENDSRRHEGLAACFYKAGDMEKAHAMTVRALEIFPGNVYAHVISGNIFFSRGKLDEAVREYEQAARQSRAPSWQHAEALNGLGRIYSVRGDLAKSLVYYGQAAALNPHSSVICTNQGIVLEKRGSVAEAATFYQKAVRTNPQDQIASSLLAGAEKKQAFSDDQAQQQRIDLLIGELIEAGKRAPPSKPAADSWTSRPLTISFMSFQYQGTPSMREGENEFFQLKLHALLQESGRVQVVERELLDKLLEELKLSTTDLLNHERALALGKILAAQLIATGSMTRSGMDVQVSMRFMETETTSLKAAITETAQDINKLAEKTTREILSKLTRAYPLRGVILSMDGNQAVLNIGTNVGAYKGMEMQVVAAEQTQKRKQSPERSGKIGTIRLTAVERNAAYAAIPSDLTGITKGMKVEAVAP